MITAQSSLKKSSQKKDVETKNWHPEGPTQAKVQDKTLAMPKSPICKAPSRAS